LERKPNEQQSSNEETSRHSNFTSDSESMDRVKMEYASITNRNYFDLLNLNPMRKEMELDLAEKRKNDIEKIIFKIELNNLDPKLQKEQVFQIEVLFTNTDNIHNFFTIGCSHRYKPSDDLSLRFPEEFEINYLFERIQFLRVVIYLSDASTSEISVNIAQVVRQNFKDCTIPIDLVNGECILYSENKVDKTKQEIVITFQRKSHIIEKTTPSIFVDFQFTTPDQIAKKLYYDVLTENESLQKKFVYKSNEVMGQGPFEFTVVSVENNNVFLDPKIAIYCFEFYEEEVYIGQILIEKTEMDEIIDSNNAIPYSVSNEGNQFNIFKKVTTRTQVSNRNLHDATNPIIKKTSNLSSLIKKKKSKVITKKELTTGNNLKNKEPTDNDEEDEENDTSFEFKKYHTQMPSNSLTEDCFQIGKANILYKDIKTLRFIDYIIKGLEITLPIAVDFTASNLNPINPKSLHTLDFEKNKYIKTIKSFTKIVKDYNNNKSYSVFGFGAIPKESKEVSHCFNLNMNSKCANIESVEEIQSHYEKRLKSSRFSNPTYLQFVLKEVIALVKKLKTETKNQNYSILLILIDGVFDDFNEVRNLLVQASKLPMSVLIIGIGQTNFSRLDALSKFIT